MENNLRDSLIGDWGSEGFSVARIVKMLAERNIPTAKKTVAKVLKNKGFEYDKTSHSWHKPIIEENIRVSNTNEGSAVEKLEIEQNNYISNTNAQLVEMLGFTPTEFNVLKTMIAERMGGESNSGKKNLVEEVAKLRVRERKNRSYYISKEIADRVAELAEENNLKISNVIEVALLDFLHNYSDEKNL